MTLIRLVNFTLFFAILAAFAVPFISYGAGFSPIWECQSFGVSIKDLPNRKWLENINYHHLTTNFVSHEDIELTRASSREAAKSALSRTCYNRNLFGGHIYTSRACEDIVGLAYCREVKPILCEVKVTSRNDQVFANAAFAGLLTAKEKVNGSLDFRGFIPANPQADDTPPGRSNSDDDETLMQNLIFDRCALSLCQLKTAFRMQACTPEDYEKARSSSLAQQKCGALADRVKCSE